jgi:hypothetical protein
LAICHPQTPTDTEVASALEGGDGYLAFAGDRDLAGTAHVVLIASTARSEVVPFCVIRALNGARTAAVNAEVARAGQLVTDWGFVVEGIVTDGNPSEIREDLTKPCLKMVSTLDRMRKTRDSASEPELPAYQMMGLAKGNLERWIHNYDLFHTLNNLRSGLAKKDFLLLWPPTKELDDLVAGIRMAGTWRPGPARPGTEVSKEQLHASGVSDIYFVTNPYDSMDQAKSLEEFGGYHFRLILAAWGEGRIEGAHLLLWTMAYLMVSVRTLDLGRVESTRRWTWAWALSTIMAGA